MRKIFVFESPESSNPEEFFKRMSEDFSKFGEVTEPNKDELLAIVNEEVKKHGEINGKARPSKG